MRQCKVFINEVEAGLLQETDDRQYIFTSLASLHSTKACSAKACN